MTRLPWIGVVLAVVASCAPAPPMALPVPVPPARLAAPLTLESLTPGQAVGGFVPVARYVDGEGRARGARLTHTRTGFVLDYLAIETAPQAFVYVTTYPSSDRGEPHTQEHLLLGRGNKGRFLGNFEHTNLVASTAFTAQFRTAYHFHTNAAPGGFWDALHAELDAILHADYTDEEIRREVRDFGVSKGQDGKLALEEKGTVYNEMVRSYEEPDRLAWFALGHLVYGPRHPLALSSGGTPEGIRELGPEQIRAFYAAHYRLDNMGMIAALPKALPLADALAHIGETLDGFALTPPPPAGSLAGAAKPMKEADLPEVHGAAPGSTEEVLYPHASEDHPGSFLFGWPATRALVADERILMELFLGAVGGGEGSRLYAALIDQKTRTLDVGATRVWVDVSREPGQAIFAGLESVRPQNANEASLRQVREKIASELAAVAALPDGSKELAELAERVQARVTEARRALDKRLDTPPEFGVRGTYDAWIDLLTDVQNDEGFDKSLVRARALSRTEALLKESKNPWRDRIHAWGLDAVPYGIATRPSAALRKSLDEARASRVGAELSRLKSVYGTPDPEVALAKRRAAIEAADEAIARAEATVPMPPLTHDPPMTEDDLLESSEVKVAGVPVVVSTFDGMKSATVGLALRLDSVPGRLLHYVALLPSLMREVGIVKDGVPIPYDQVRDRLRREILDASVYASPSFSSGRAELVFEASGNDLAEARRAVAWMRDFLTSSDLRLENLPRIKDVVGRKVAELGDVMSGAEEHWVESVEEAYWRQGWPLLAHTGSFLTRAHDAHRLSWRLEEGDPLFKDFLDALASAAKGQKRASLAKLAAALASEDKALKVDPALASYLAKGRGLPASDRPMVLKAGRDLGRLLGDIPDESLATDWAEVCREMKAGVLSGPASTLAAIQEVLAFVRHADNARAWIVGSRASEEALRPDLEKLFGALDPHSSQRVTYTSAPHVLDRAIARGAKVPDPSWVALVNPNTANAAYTASAKLAAYDDPSDAAMDLYLATNVPSGTGSHGLYKRIWGAGLAYSGYVWASPRYGRYELYSDRCADLASLLRFVDGQLRVLPGGASMVEYAAARAFSSRAADTYETRGRARATDLAEGFPPDRVRAFRERVLAARHRPGISEAIQALSLPAYETLLPTGEAAAAVRAEALHVLVAPEGQIAATEHALRTARGSKADFAIGRLYPRDFWYVAPVTSPPAGGTGKAGEAP
jgi:Zn-dependent M16 (insulinase) family peptidase